MEKIGKRERVKIEELGLLIKTIQLDYSPTTNKEMSDLISEYFNVICIEEDIDQYYILYDHHEELVKVYEDYELESRREEYFQSLGTKNPFN